MQIDGILRERILREEFILEISSRMSPEEEPIDAKRQKKKQAHPSWVRRMGLELAAKGSWEELAALLNTCLIVW